LPPLLLYTAYYGMPQNNVLLYARFALASFPALVLLAMIWPAFLAEGKSAFRTVVALVAGGSIILSSFSPFLNHPIDELNNTMLAAFAIGDVVRRNAPPGSVVVADVFTQYFIDYVGDYIVYTRDMYSHPLLDNRLADLKRVPHENDPARTEQM